MLISRSGPSFEWVRQLDCGKARVCTCEEGEWKVHEAAKQAILDVLKSSPCSLGTAGSYDKVASKFENWTEGDFQAAGLRVAPTAFVRWGAFLNRGVVLMPQCFVNMGAFVGEKTMIDSNVTVGSCCQIGDRCHIGAGSVLGGVLEPMAARPVILEGDVFVGAQATLAEGILVRSGAVIAAGVHLTASTWIIERKTGRKWKGEVPPRAVVIPGAYPAGLPGVSVQCALIDHYKGEPTSVVNEHLRPLEKEKVQEPSLEESPAVFASASNSSFSDPSDSCHD